MITREEILEEIKADRLSDGDLGEIGQLVTEELAKVYDSSVTKIQLSNCVQTVLHTEWSEALDMSNDEYLKVVGEIEATVTSVLVALVTHAKSKAQ